ncbi:MULTISPECIES: hypothetical protein [unclassified Methanoregula]|uniref:hypothetical protein n=1 Tax=unclassified Methanoregula TaxID=2649730 RepID=UPI0025CC1488|nr:MULTISPECIES: hypothetical protein [unclassified Methanoregula]
MEVKPPFCATSPRSMTGRIAIADNHLFVCVHKNLLSEYRKAGAATAAGAEHQRSPRERLFFINDFSRAFFRYRYPVFIFKSDPGFFIPISITIAIKKRSGKIDLRFSDQNRSAISGSKTDPDLQEKIDPRLKTRPGHLSTDGA